MMVIWKWLENRWGNINKISTFILKKTAFVSLGSFFYFNYILKMNDIITFFESSLLTCPSKKLMGIECLGCGLQRSFILLMKGNILESIKMYPALIPLLFMMVYLTGHLYFNFKNGARFLKYFYFLNIILIVANYIIKQFL